MRRRVGQSEFRWEAASQKARGVPDYTARGVRWQLFGVLALGLLLLAIAEHAGRAWFGGWQVEGSQPGTGSAGHRAAARQPSAEETPEATSGDLANGQNAESAKEADAAWGEVYLRLTGEQQVLLFEWLYRSQTHDVLPESKQNAAAGLLADVNRHWEEVVQEGGGEQSEVRSQLRRRWKATVEPALQAALDGRTLVDREEHALAELQQAIDAAALKQVEDDTVFLRPAERPIWLRLMAQVADQSQPANGRTRLEESPPAEAVSYAQLFHQPAEYRGRMVTFRGTLKRATEVPTTENFLGARRQFVLWIMPESVASPIVVYALEMPRGFPAIRDAEGRPARLNEPVEIAGIFLKRGAYLGQGGTYTAPLLISKSFQWQPSERALASVPQALGGTGWIASAIGLALVVSLVIFLLTYWRIRAGEAEARAIFRGGLRRSLPDERGLAIGPSVAESLRQLEEEARRG